MFPDEGWDVELLIDGIRGFLGSEFVIGCLAIIYTFIFAGRLFRLLKGIGGTVGK